MDHWFLEGFLIEIKAYDSSEYGSNWRRTDGSNDYWNYGYPLSNHLHLILDGTGAMILTFNNFIFQL